MMESTTIVLLDISEFSETVIKDPKMEFEIIHVE